MLMVVVVIIFGYEWYYHMSVFIESIIFSSFESFK